MNINLKSKFLESLTGLKLLVTEKVKGLSELQVLKYVLFINYIDFKLSSVEDLKEYYNKGIELGQTGLKEARKNGKKSKVDKIRKELKKARLFLSNNELGYFNIGKDEIGGLLSMNGAQINIMKKQLRYYGLLDISYSYKVGVFGQGHKLGVEVLKLKLNNSIQGNNLYERIDLNSVGKSQLNFLMRFKEKLNKKNKKRYPNSYKVIYNTIDSMRIDSEKIQKEHPELYLSRITIIAQINTPIMDYTGKLIYRKRFRLEHPLSRLDKKLRKYLYDPSGKIINMKSLDVTDSQLHFLMNELRTDNYLQMCEDFRLFDSLLQKGKLKNFLIENLGGNREEIKSQMTGTILFGKSSIKGLWARLFNGELDEKDKVNLAFIEALRDIFPNVVENIYNRKDKFNGNLPIKLQKKEAIFMLDRVNVELSKKLDAYFTVHDCVVADESKMGIVEDVFKEVSMKEFGYILPYKIEDWCDG